MSWENTLKYSTRDMMRDEREDDDLRHSRRIEAQAEYDLQTSDEHFDDEQSVEDFIDEVEKKYGLDTILWTLADKHFDGDIVSMLKQIIQDM